MDGQAFVSERIVTPGGIRPGAIIVRNDVRDGVREGKISGIVPADQLPAHAEAHDFGESTILPGLVDSHVHINDPGRAEWEGFETATRAAAEGGVTTLVDMPLNCLPPTTTATALDRKQPTARGGWVDVGFWGGAVPGSHGELAGLHRAGVFGFKAFLLD